jgi:hypothetical protein
MAQVPNVPVAGLQADKRNARLHTDRNRAMIRQSLEEIGPFRSIAVDGEGVIRAGNGVFEQALALGLRVRVVDAAPDELIAVRRRDLTGRQAERAALWDNRTAESGEWDPDGIAALAADGEDIFQGIFEDHELEAWLATRLQDAAGEKRPDRDPGGDPRKQIKPVLYAEEVEVFERALRATGQQNRGQALIEVCRYFLGHHGGRTEGQFDALVESLLEA